MLAIRPSSLHENGGGLIRRKRFMVTYGFHGTPNRGTGGFRWVFRLDHAMGTSLSSLLGVSGDPAGPESGDPLIRIRHMAVPRHKILFHGPTISPCCLQLHAKFPDWKLTNCMQRIFVGRFQSKA